MASADRPAPQHLSFLQAAREGVRRTGLFPIVRGAEARAPSLPRVGESKRPAQNVVDLAHVPTLSFPEKTIEDVRVTGGRAKVSGYWLGLTGPMGPLPTHLSEFSMYERRYAKKQPFSDFLDLLAGRMLQLFYRCWADSQPAVHADRPKDDRFGYYLSALSGAAEGASDADLFPARARLHYAALFASRRSAQALEDALSHLLGLDVQVLEFQPRWRDMEEEDRSRLGRSFATLGSDAVLGRKVRVASDAFRVVIKTDSLRQFESLLPSGNLFAIAAEALDAFAPKHLDWDLMLEIDEGKAPPTKLDGRSRLGWTSWVAPRHKGRLRADAHLTKYGRKSKIRKGATQ